MLIHPAVFIKWPFKANSVERSGCVTPLLWTILSSVDRPRIVGHRFT